MRLGTCCALALGLFVAAPGRAETPTEQGNRAFSAGVALLQDPDGAKYDEALIEFRKAYGLLKNWKILGNIGLCALKLERDGEAVDVYERYLREGGAQIEKNERQQVERDLLRLRTQLVRVRLEAGSRPTSIIDERIPLQGNRIVNEYPAGAEAIDFGLHPGHHRIVARFEHGSSVWDVQVDSGARVTHRFEPPRDDPTATPSSPTGQRTVAVIVGGLGLVGVGVGSVLALQAKAHYDESSPYCAGKLCTQQGVDIAEEGRSKGTVATIVFGAGAAAAATGLILWVTARGSTPERASSYQGGVALGPGEVTFLGSF